MKLKLLQNIIHEGVLFRAGEVVEGIADHICENVVSRGLAELSEDEPTRVYTHQGVEPKPVVNPHEDTTSSNQQSTTQAVAGNDTVPTGAGAPVDAGVTAPVEDAPVEPPAPEAPVTPPVDPSQQQPPMQPPVVVQPPAPQTNPGLIARARQAVSGQPTPEQIQKEIEGIQ